MVDERRFLIIDAYPQESREQFEDVGMRLGWQLYRDMLHAYRPGAEFDVWLASDSPGDVPEDVGRYAGLLWPGCNLTVYHDDDARVAVQVDLAKRAYQVGVPQFGTCWGLQIGVYAAGGEVTAHPCGREMGVARKIRLAEAGRDHPMFAGKPVVYSHFVSHDDEVTGLPRGATLLAGNDYSRVQAAEIRCEQGVFWGLQYHPEYDLHEMARLIVAREPKLVTQGFFRGHDDLTEYVERLETLAREPDRKDLRWQLGIDDDLLEPEIRQCEFINWLRCFVTDSRAD